MDESHPENLNSVDVVGVVLADIPLLHDMEVGYNALVWQTRVVVLLFKKEDQRVYPNYLTKDHTPQPPRESLSQGTEERNLSLYRSVMIKKDLSQKTALDLPIYLHS